MGFFAEMLLHCLCVLYLFFLLAACHCRCICFYSFLFISFKEIQMNTIRMSLKNQTYVHFVVALLLHTPITNHSLTLVCNRNVYGSPYDGIFFWRKSLHCINILILIFNDAYTITPHHHLHFRVFV